VLGQRGAAVLKAVQAVVVVALAMDFALPVTARLTLSNGMMAGITVNADLIQEDTAAAVALHRKEVA
jgi:hypothetical protein